MLKTILTTLSCSAATVACALAVLGAGAGTALAPDPGRLNSDSPLAASSNAWAYGIWVESRTPTYGFHLSNQWQQGYPYASYAGYPCSRYAQPGGTVLSGYIQRYGTFTRCSEY